MTDSPASPGDYLSDVFFSDLDIPLPVRAGIAACGFTRATPVQAESLPLLLAGRDVAAQAQTGTGKTAAYLISILTRLLRRPAPQGYRPGAPRALIVAPTRELAVQIDADARALSGFVAPRIVTVFGGIDYGRQRDLLRSGCDILIGTPGRLLDYEGQGATSFGWVESLVIDECDRLFDLGFIVDLRRILRRCPPAGRRHSMMFSATLSVRVMELAWEHMNDAVKVEIRPDQVTADRVVQSLYHVSAGEKISLLLGLLSRLPGDSRTMLFVNTKRLAERLVGILSRKGYKAGSLNGDLPQPRRLKILSEFKAGKLPLLVATDVASRGLHIDGVTHVVNVDLPQDPEDYVHRIGRTARAGRAGAAISLACEDYVFSLDAIERLIGQKIPVVHPDDDLYLPVFTHTPQAPRAFASGGSHRGAAEERPDEDDVPLPIEAPLPPPPPPPRRAPHPRPARAARPAPPVEAPGPVEAAGPAAPVAAVAPAAAVEEIAAIELVAPSVAADEGEPADDLAAPPPGEADFWTREAFALEIPAEGFHVASSPAAPSPAPAKPRRRRRRRPAQPSAPPAAGS